MGAKRKARKEFAKEQELEKLRARKERATANAERAAKARQEKKAALKARIDAMSPEEKTAYLKKRNIKRLVIAAAVVAFLVISIASGGGNSSSTSTGTATSQTRNYAATIDGTAVINPATLAVRFSVTNDGTQTVTPSCKIDAKDPSSTYRGFDIFVIDPIKPGGIEHAAGNLTITKEGASFVTDLTISCTANTTDTATSAGKEVTITNISTDGFSAYDTDAQSWYWGVTFKAAGVDKNTRLTCTQVAYNASGKEIARHTYSAVTANDLTVVSYGQNEIAMPDTTKAIAKAISNVKVSCVL
jgi:hypothetical protein